MRLLEDIGLVATPSFVVAAAVLALVALLVLVVFF